MSTFLLLTLARILGDFGFSWTDDLAARAEAAAVVQRDRGSRAVQSRSAGSQQAAEPEPHARVWGDEDDGISNGF